MSVIGPNGPPEAASDVVGPKIAHSPAILLWSPAEYGTGTRECPSHECPSRTSRPLACVQVRYEKHCVSASRIKGVLWWAKGNQLFYKVLRRWRRSPYCLLGCDICPGIRAPTVPTDGRYNRSSYSMIGSFAHSISYVFCVAMWSVRSLRKVS